ncbi:Ribosomal protein L18/L5 [Macleaya cordata]|uniref:Ribosomal protein L18/L5 n=1 Tax=Macleaya cordata TaxID=56857 RepID=A0A200R809_MACCD|nr:Ribosomal protein L18/L5 [Macleaya cordata]
MASSILRRRIIVPFPSNSPILLSVCNFCSDPSRILDNEKESKLSTINSANQFHLSPFLPHTRIHEDDFKIELVDPDIWRVSSSLAQSWKETEKKSAKTNSSISESVDETVNHSHIYSSCIENNESEPDFDDIEDMRIRGNLFYKLDRDSREYEEYNFSFHKKKSLKSNQSKEDPKESKKKEKQNLARDEKVANLEKMKIRASPSIRALNNGSFDEVKKLRTQTFNQLTGPYHEPFCLDIYISKSSVRACIVHRATSKVVAVAHSISKDMKFDLSSTRDYTACAAVGGALAQRALGDDIHDVIYTPRKGEKLEGKLQIVLQSVIDNGINVKVKIKQRISKKVLSLPSK